ncbi:uncharacterized protein LOC133799911 [Humulus lupulus]|uniref:uncharacterized protein LOC133799911 n=1 Tax=Humulus lupulus TaxID=3486 RepID=UPI002B412517|nr:uncharacterized protein LOC133799911 [Humulus lupulus]
MEFSYNNRCQSTIGLAPYEMLYGCKCRSPLHWDEIGKKQIVGPEAVGEASEVIEKIHQRMLTAQSRQKRYADLKKRDIAFSVGEFVSFRVSPIKGVMCFSKKGKLSLRYIGPFEILDRVWQVVYGLALPPTLSKTHNVFYISMLRKHMSDPSHVLSYEPLQLMQDLSYDEQFERIIEEGVKQLRFKKIPLVKVLWKNITKREATWELEEDMRERYSELFA